jgi:hypothetical protein
MAGNHEVVENQNSGTTPFIPFHVLRKLKSMIKDPLEGPCRFSCGSCFFCILHEQLQKHRLHKARRHLDISAG